MITKERFKKISADLSVQDVYDELDVACDEMYTVSSEVPNTAQTMETVIEFLKNAAKAAGKVDEGLQDECSRLARNAKAHLEDYVNMARDAEDLYKAIKKLKS